MVYLHPTLQSPDPTLEGKTRQEGEQECVMEVFPHHVVRARAGRAVTAWGERLHLHRDPGPVVVTGDAAGRAELLLDFGTELFAWLELIVATRQKVCVMATFGEHEVEAGGYVPCAEPVRPMLPAERPR